MKKRNRENLKLAFRIMAILLAIIMILGIIFGHGL